MSTEPLLRVRGLSKSYQEGEREHEVLHRTDLEVREGEFVAIMGPSGCGKSTLLNLISGIDLPDEGEVILGGERVTGMTERDRTLLRRRRIGFVFQFFNLVPTLTVEENLLLPLELRGGLGEEDRERARSLLDRVGLADRLDSFPDRLSGGEQQRVAVARALVHRPDLILADEPTGNLDEATGGRVMDLLEGLVRTDGGTLLLVTHNRAQAERADRILGIREGRLEPAGG
ncbi:MAG: ATP-binding cassette domain-containing protein [Gemmatimonadetes bacterium]|nr:ABC transporter ATP-binding protein [Gemmatimonadota bacterium]NIR80211.1 ABC transporter ATP-binding protein [Gemmatimonadota bacterium]NIT88976.1 ABC transporter ATP-binding protein [Gemmatimonadota bacterium]NIU32772.1 ABC transporter ATP-binding protein [Gemmatimonadota bacterium]NIU37203.1 ATP-binding cassette domain-containing protein [Gemmatimonadota bacterium]